MTPLDHDDFTGQRFSAEQDCSGPIDSEIPLGWSVLKVGTVKYGDRMWNYKDRAWLSVTRTTFIGQKITPKHWLKIIRKNKT